MVEQRPRHRLRWFQFSLRTLLALMTVAAGLLVTWRLLIGPYRVQEEAMSALKELGASYRTQPGPDWVAKLRGKKSTQIVVSVDLGQCDLPDKYMVQLVRLPDLENLIVSGPRFRDEHLTRLGRRKALRRLVLDSTGVTRAALAALRQKRPELAIFRSDRRAIVSLEKRRVSFATRPVDVPQAIKPLLDEEHFCEAVLLNAHGARLTDRDLEVIASMKALEELRLGGTRVTNAGLKHLADLTQLRWLDLSDTRVTGDGLIVLQALDRLTMLWLNGTALDDWALHHLIKLRDLTHLDLRGTQVSNEGLRHLTGLNKLDTLYLSRTKVTDEGVADLRSVLSELNIVR